MAIIIEPDDILAHSHACNVVPMLSATIMQPARQHLKSTATSLETTIHSHHALQLDTVPAG